MGGGGKVLRALFGTVVVLGVIWFFVVGILANHATKTTKVVTLTSSRSFYRLKFIGEEKHHFHQYLNLNYVSKRRVPNGPDPIHNRRASKSRQPPGRA